MIVAMDMVMFTIWLSFAGAAATRLFRAVLRQRGSGHALVRGAGRLPWPRSGSSLLYGLAHVLLRRADRGPGTTGIC